MLAWLVPLFFFAVLMGSPVAGFLAFTVIGMVHAWQSWRQPHMANAFKWTREDSWLALCFMSIPLFKALSALWSEAPALAFQNAFWHAYYLFWPLVLLGLDRCQSDPRKVQIGLSLGLIVFGLHALFLEMSGDALHVPGVRANVGILAQLAMTAGIWSVIALTKPDTTFQWRCVHGAAALATGIVLVFSTRRLELMGFVALTGLVGLYRLRKQMTFWRALFLAVSAVAALAILIYLRKEKFAEGFAELGTYLYHRQEHPEVIYSSWGARLEMWRTAWAAFMDHPILGISASARPFTMQAWEGPTNEALFGHRHFHSHLMQTLVEGGLLGLMLLLASLTSYIKLMITRVHATRPEAALLAAGLLGAYFMEGLASAALQYDKPNALLVVASAWVWLQIRTMSVHRPLA